MTILVDRGPLIIRPNYVHYLDNSGFTASGDFTLEVGNVKFIAPLADGGIYGDYLSDGNQRSLLLSYSGTQLALNLSTTGGTPTQALYTWTPATDGTAYQICGERTGSSVRLYVDGAVVATATVSGALHNSNQRKLIGTRDDSGTLRRFTGSFEAIRFTMVARYSGAYTPPTLPFPH